MSFQVYRKHTSSKQNERIKMLLARLEKFEAEQNPIENEGLIAKGFTDRSRMSYHDELTFTKLSNLSDDMVRMPIEPDGDKFGLWYTFDELTSLSDKSFFNHEGELFGITACGALAEGVNEGIGAGGTICMKFDGSTNYVKTTTSSRLQLADQSTGINFFIRFKPTDLNGIHTLFEKLDDTTPSYAYKVMIMNGDLIFMIKYDGEEYIIGTGAGVIANNNWYDCWFRFNISTLEPSIYLNNTFYNAGQGGGGYSRQGFSTAGFSTGYINLEFGDITLNGTSLIIGNGVNLDSYFTGYIQDFRVWNNMLVSSTQIGYMWTNKVSISNIAFEKVCVIGLSLINGRIRRTINEPSISVSDQVTVTYLPSNPYIRTINEPSISVSDSPAVAKNPVIPRVISEPPILVSETVSISRAGLKVKLGNIIKSTQKSGLPFTVSYSQTVGFTPKFIIFWGTFNTQYDNWNGDDRFFIGFADGTNNVGLGCSAADASDSSQSAKGLYNSCLVNIQYDDTEEVLGTCAFTTDGFRITYTENDTNDPRIINYLALGGSVTAKVGTFVQPTTVTGNHQVTGVGFQPSMIMLMPTGVTTINTHSPNSTFSFGAARTTTERFSLSGTDDDGVSTTNTFRIARTDKALTLLNSGVGTVLKSADFVSMDVGGFTLNYDTATGVAGLCAYAALAGVRCSIGNFVPTSGTGLQKIVVVDPLSEESAGFKPSVVIFTGHGRAAENVNTSSSEFKMGFGAGVTSLNRRSTAFHIKDNESNSIAVNRSQSGRCFQIITGAESSEDSTIRFEMDLVSMDSDGFTINKRVNDGTTQNIMFIMLG